MTEDKRDITLKAVYTLWLNNYMSIDGITINDIYTDFSNGQTLPKLVEILFDEKIKINTKLKTPSIYQSNNEKALNALIKIGAIDPNSGITAVDFSANKKDNHKKLLRFFGSLITKYAIAPITYNGETGKDGLRKWCQDNSDDYDISNWGSAWDKSQAFYAIMRHFYPDAFEMENANNQSLIQFTNQTDETSNDENVNVIIASELFYFFADFNQYLPPDAKIRKMLQKKGNSFIWSHIKEKKIAYREPEMIQASFKVQETLPNNKKRTLEYNPNINDVTRKLNALGMDKVIIITVIGSYQTGKSSTIRRLTSFHGVKIGDGVHDETEGAVMYGPFSYNKIRREFGLKNVPQDINLMFIDTEGSNGFFEENSFECATNLIVNLLTPFAAVSDIILTLNKTTITKPEIFSTNELYNAVKSIRSDWQNIDIVNIFTNYPGYNPQNADLTKKVFDAVKDASVEKFPNIPFIDTIPLVNFDVKDNKDIFQQGEEFQQGFAIFARKLMHIIDKRKDKFIIDGRSMSKMFQDLASNRKVKGYAEIAKEIAKIREEGKEMTYIRIYERTCKKIMAEEISNMNKFFEEYRNNLEAGKDLSKIDFKVDERTQNVISLLKEKIPESLQDVKYFTEYEQSIKKQIQECANNYTSYNKAMIEMIQERHVTEMIATYIRKAYNIISADMENTNGHKFDEVFDKNTPNLLKQGIDKEFERIKSKYTFDKNVVSKIERKVKLLCNDYVKKIRSEADAIAKRNRDEAGFWDKFIHDIKEFFCGQKIRDSILTLEKLDSQIK